MNTGMDFKTTERRENKKMSNEAIDPRFAGAHYGNDLHPAPVAQQDKAGHCNECNKKQAEGWALYCVECLTAALSSQDSRKAAQPQEQRFDEVGSLKPSYEDLEALYDGQCELTDQMAAKLEAVSDKTLLARIAELETALATMNRRYAELNSAKESK